MSIEEIARYAKIKGLQVVGTGDFTHPDWLMEVQQTLRPEDGTGLFKVAENPELATKFMLTAEVCTIFDYEEKTRKVHHVIFTPSIDTAIQINDALAEYGDLGADGRPILGMTAPQLVEEVMEVSGENIVFPAHAWTPWFSVFGAFSGFDTLEDCYQDMTKHIHALETGLSSDPPMNWRLSNLDKYTLLSNSDSHSFWPWRMGREANVFELKHATYKEITQAIREKDASKLKFTIETDPAYGKYHWTGHRSCNVSLSPAQAREHNNICPVCHRSLTKGVEQRVEELADRPENFKLDGAAGFMRLLPLSEIIAAVLGVESPSTQTVWKVYNALVDKFGDEYTVLIDTPRHDLKTVVQPAVAETIVSVREGTIKVIPGYDGVYGKLDVEKIKREAIKPKPAKTRNGAQQLGLSEFW
ncbi:MAG: endonuclease Q family protein [Candidatus Bathyarchaeota archaeon]|nr:endonuclease Q family protein [Candidatus Bathyarchaeota archaeon]